ncbi:Disintegrin and metalloproteinase domain-containing protein 18 [Cricetulus griseus]|uniref:Disintegrin and metalloproteinase domain-containing protein 18 n=1 Tax=Cricetulus griseus TaxID=10029 RepID=G3H1K8_CRIGR|nr:Disintegrin and metalloproteinase domain-containing protein 18 [Cricetulus griseus]
MERERDRQSPSSPKEESSAKAGYLLLRWGILTVSLSAESETPFLQITVPQKIESNIKDAKAAEAQAHCFYQGHAAEIPASTVTLSTCSGLRGLLQLENITYGIEPLESSATFEHMIYQIKNNNIDYSPLRDNLNSQHESQSYRILVKPEKAENVSLMKRTLRVKIVMDKAMMFSELKMTVMLTSLEIWSDENKIETNGDADEVLQRFLVWKQNQPSERVKVIMYLLLRSQGIKVFSSCSMDAFKQLASQPDLDCLREKPEPEFEALPQVTMCGNNILEGSEECDCGPEETCIHKNCCDPEKCTLVRCQSTMDDAGEMEFDILGNAEGSRTSLVP